MKRKMKFGAMDTMERSEAQNFCLLLWTKRLSELAI